MENIYKMSVLYVEDDLGAMESLLPSLKRRFSTVVTATDGKEGLDKYILFRPDIVITDIEMPIMGGIDMSEMIRGINPHVPIIATTAHNSPDNISALERVGINYRIAKPIIKDQLLEAFLECSKLVESS